MIYILMYLYVRPLIPRHSTLKNDESRLKTIMLETKDSTTKVDRENFVSKVMSTLFVYEYYYVFPLGTMIL